VVPRILGVAPALLFSLVGAGCERADGSDGALGRLLDRGAPPAFPDGLDRVFDGFVEGCKRRDASGIWSTFTPRLRAELDARAEETLQATAVDVLRQRYAYEGHPAGFDGSAYLAGLLHAGGERDPCHDADLWRRIDVGPEARDRNDTAWVFVVEHPSGARQAFRFVEAEGAWWIDQLSPLRAAVTST